MKTIVGTWLLFLSSFSCIASPLSARTGTKQMLVDKQAESTIHVKSRGNDRLPLINANDRVLGILKVHVVRKSGGIGLPVFHRDKSGWLMPLGLTPSEFRSVLVGFCMRHNITLDYR